MDKTEQNGLFFEWNGTTFRVVARKSGTDTAVASDSFNGDQTFSPGESNNTYRIHYSAGRALFQRASAGKIINLHTMTDDDYPLVDDLDLGLYYENTNTGNTTNKEMRIRGSSSSIFGNPARYNEGGGQLTASFYDEVSRGRVPGFSSVIKFGRIDDVDIGTPEDIWNGQGKYTGFDATGNENIEVFSANANDVGIVESSGTATAGNTTTLTDSGATFVTDGVTTGDVLVNDTQAIHGVITAVTETQVTVFDMEGDSFGQLSNSEGDSYRIVSTNGTGAALVRIEQLLNEDYEIQSSQYVVLNGTTGVTVTGDFIRCTRAKIILAGSGEENAGEITVRQITTTANVFAVMPQGSSQTTIAAYTIPKGKVGLLKRIRAEITRANGSSGSANVEISVRNFGEVFRAIRSFEIQTGAAVSFTQLGADLLRPGADIKARVKSVSDNNTIATAAFEIVLIEE